MKPPSARGGEEPAYSVCSVALGMPVDLFLSRPARNRMLWWILEPRVVEVPYLWSQGDEPASEKDCGDRTTGISAGEAQTAALLAPRDAVDGPRWEWDPRGASIGRFRSIETPPDPPKRIITAAVPPAPPPAPPAEAPRSAEQRDRGAEIGDLVRIKATIERQIMGAGHPMTVRFSLAGDVGRIVGIERPARWSDEITGYRAQNVNNGRKSPVMVLQRHEFDWVGLGRHGFTKNWRITVRGRVRSRTRTGVVKYATEMRG